ncbi:MAG: outer membrane beta-barrel protein [Pseudomonadota bacterium]
MISRFAVLAACCAAGAANAADNGVYLGLGAERSDFNIDGALDNTDNGLKLIGGVRLLDSFGVELNYADHGKATVPSGIVCAAIVGQNCPDTSRISAKTTAAYAVGFLDFPVVDLFAKAGLARMDGRLTTPNQPNFSFKDNDTDLAWGLGAQVHFVSLGARIEVEQFKLFGEKLRTISASFFYTIL